MGCRKRTASWPGWSLEAEAWKAGYSAVAGIDEAGRGCLFGPVFAAAAILDRRARLPGLADSKRLSASRRAELELRIRSSARAWSVEAVDAAEIDQLNILQASRLAMRRAVEALQPAPDFLLVDALAVDVEVDQRAVIRGDRKSCSVAAASILAKVARDRCLEAWDAVYPLYGLRRHKGYPTREHLAALRSLGCLPQHRRSFSPVARASSAPSEPPSSGLP